MRKQILNPRLLVHDVPYKYTKGDEVRSKIIVLNLQDFDTHTMRGRPA